MGLNTIAAVLEKKGQGFVDKILEGEVVITEKLDTFRILFEQNNGVLTFYKKDNTPITLIERTLNDIWEAALLEIPTLINETKLPEGIRFGVAYTPVERPLRIPYTNLPRYILTDMTKRKKGKVVEAYNYDEITQWAGILCMAKPPVLFEGILSKKQKNMIMSYELKQYEGDFNSFNEMIKETLNNTYSNSDIIEGIIIKSGKTLTQIISYEFEMLSEAYYNNKQSRDFYDIVLLSITNFMDSYKFPILESNDGDSSYIEIISNMFVEYCKSNKITEGLEPKYLSSPQFGHVGKLNKHFIDNKEAIRFVESDPIYEALFKVFISSFRKYKKPYGLLSEVVIDKFNTYVGLINDMTNQGLDSTDFLNESSENIVVNKVGEKIHNDMNSMRVISSIQNAFTPPKYNIEKGKQKVIIYLTSFEPFTSSQMINIEQIHNKWNVPVILAAVSSVNTRKGKDFHLSDGLIMSQMRSLSNFNKKLIPSFMLLDSWDLKEIFQYARPDYEPLLIITDVGKKSDISLQLYYEEEIMGGKISVLPEFNIGEMENKEELVSKRSIEDGNGSAFLELTPKAVHIFYDNIINEFKNWEGSIIPQFQPTIYTEVK